MAEWEQNKKGSYNLPNNKNFRPRKLRLTKKQMQI